MLPPAETPPRLSVILFGRRFEDFRATVRLLSAQTIANSIEVLIVHPSQSKPTVPSEVGAAFHSCRIIDTGNARSLAEAKAHGVRAAAGSLVAFSEDHSFPESTWAEELVAGFTGGYTGVAPRMANGTPNSLLSRIAMVLHFGGGFVENAAGYETETPMASHNMSYRRDALLELGEELDARMLMEFFLIDVLRERGHRFRVQPSAVTHHMNMCYLAPLMRHAWIGGRMHGALRVRFHRWGIARRILQAAAVPLVPPLMARRALRQPRPDDRSADVRFGLPAMLLILSAHAAGEAIGSVMGMGRADEQYSLYEVGRDRFVFPEYRARWA